MFQSFDASSSPEQGPPRLAALRVEMATAGLDGFLVPRADAHQGEYVAPRDERLAWLTGFTGSAGFAAVLKDIAGVFVDGRYRVQVKDQVAEVFTPVHWPETHLADWLREQLPSGKIGFDPWLHTLQQVEDLQKRLVGTEITLVPCPNLIDAIWADQPAPPQARAFAQPIDFAGESSASKRNRLAETLRDKGVRSAIITLPDSLCWLLNIRGSDIAHNPVMQGFGILHADGTADLFATPDKLTELDAHLGDGVTCHAPDALLAQLGDLKGPVLIEKSSAPLALSSALGAAGVDILYGEDPCALPKARKNSAEIEGSAEAHLRDGAAVCSFLTWFDDHATSGITEIDVTRRLEESRQATNLLRDISFDTIAGAGPNGAVIHYRVTNESNRTLNPGEIMVLDSGGQYQDGTTDITRTLPIGPVGAEEKRLFTLVLKGMIAISRLRWPKGLAGRDLEAIGRVALWEAGVDFDHGLGHGVGSYLSVHEGPQRLSRLSSVPLEPGMILSNEPGYYREGAFGIRIENLIVVEDAPKLPGGDDHRDMLQFRTLTYVPIDVRLIDTDMLAPKERDWLNQYHATCLSLLEERVAPDALSWLKKATAPI